MGVARYNVMLNNELNSILPSNTILIVFSVVTFIYGITMLFRIMKYPEQKFTYKVQIVLVFAAAVSFFQGDVNNYKNMDRFYAFAYLIAYFLEVAKEKVMDKSAFNKK